MAKNGRKNKRIVQTEKTDDIEEVSIDKKTGFLFGDPRAIGAIEIIEQSDEHGAETEHQPF
ncbi:hypothetical protein K5I04_05145 [Murdochiella sp. Marseille-P8839]|nr:hypothetical protein [Murdochiella sp. Marseille-P8839]